MHSMFLDYISIFKLFVFGILLYSHTIDYTNPW